MKAICEFKKDMPHNSIGVFGKVIFEQPSCFENTLVTISLEGLPPNSTHAIHIHTTSDFSKGCMSAGPHYNPYNRLHGNIYLNGKGRHVGDLINNIKTDSEGKVYVQYSDDLVSLYNPYSVINRSVVIHEKPDDLGLGGGTNSIEALKIRQESLMTGNAGGRVACAKIEGCN